MYAIRSYYGKYLIDNVIAHKNYDLLSTILIVVLAAVTVESATSFSLVRVCWLNLAWSNRFSNQRVQTDSLVVLTSQQEKRLRAESSPP